MANIQPILAMFWNKISLLIGGLFGIAVIGCIVSILFSRWRLNIEKERLIIEKKILNELRIINKKLGDKNRI